MKTSKTDSIELVAYDANWPTMAQAEMQILRELLPQKYVIDIQHVGSTAVPNLIAKPIIDLQIAVTSLNKIKLTAIALLESIDYVFWDENPDNTRLFFAKGAPPLGKQRTHHVHIVELDSHHWREKILFRDYLIAHPELAHQYADLKLNLQKQYQFDREKYTTAKTEFIQHALELATDEFLDLVDDHDHVIGEKRRSEIYAEKLNNFRVVNVFIKNDKGELWIPRRTLEKKIFPLCLDMSMGGHVDSGETYEIALERELREELNIDITQVAVRYLGHLKPVKDRVSSFMKVYEIALNDVSDYNPSDFSEYFWLTPHALAKRISMGEKVKSDLPKLLEKFYL